MDNMDIAPRFIRFDGKGFPVFQIAGKDISVEKAVAVLDESNKQLVAAMQNVNETIGGAGGIKALDREMRIRYGYTLQQAKDEVRSCILATYALSQLAATYKREELDQ